MKLVGRGHPLDREYWRRRWREGRIGFHQEAIDPHLLRHLPGLADRVGAAHPPLRTLVPLCGKSRDLLWLGEEGHRVTGVEIAPEACALCASEQQLSPLSPPAGAERAWRRDLPGGGRLDLLQGDILDLPTPSPDGEGDAGPGWDLIWDRAALIALPARLRPRYAGHLWECLRPGGAMLLVTAEYDSAEREGPPHSVPAGEVDRLYPEAERTELERYEQDRSDGDLTTFTIVVHSLIRPAR